MDVLSNLPEAEKPAELDAAQRERLALYDEIQNVDGRNEAMTFIKAHLRRRTGRSWSVTGGRGTAWGWITVTALPAQLERGYLTAHDAALLSETLGGERVHQQGVHIPASTAFYRLYMALAAVGDPLGFKTEPYWD